MPTIPRPTLGDVAVEDKHERAVVVQLDGTEPFAAGYHRRGVEIRFQPQALRLIWKGSPPQLWVVSISGPELTKSGAINARGLATFHSYINRQWEWEDKPGDHGHMQRVSSYTLDDDTPDWVRELIARYTPDWSALDGARP
jgi:hypothetical protein